MISRAMNKALRAMVIVAWAVQNPGRIGAAGLVGEGTVELTPLRAFSVWGRISRA